MLSLGVTSHGSSIHHCILCTKLLCIHSHPSSVWTNYRYIQIYLLRLSLQAWDDVMYFSDRSIGKIKNIVDTTDRVAYWWVLHKYINRNYKSISARSVCANLWSSWLVWLRDRECTVEPERTAFTRRVRFPAAGAASYRASWKTQCLSLPGKTGLVKWYLHIPASFSAEEGFKRRKCPVAKKRATF